jgi:hypothetical protein
MFDACDFLTVLIRVGSGGLMLDKLHAAFWMLAVAKMRKVLGTYRAFETPLPREATSPFTVHLRVAAPVVLFFRRELARVIRLRLGRRKRFGDGQHAFEAYIVRGSISLLPSRID